MANTTHWVTETTEPAKWRERLLANSAQVGECREYTGRLDHDGYGTFRFTVDGRSRMTGAHRAAWLAHRGPIGPGLVIDHLCRNRACINPDHMELVTVLVNNRRGFPGRPKGWDRRVDPPRFRSTSCSRGHAYTADNSYIHRRKDRVCGPHLPHLQLRAWSSVPRASGRGLMHPRVCHSWVATMHTMCCIANSGTCSTRSRRTSRSQGTQLLP